MLNLERKGRDAVICFVIIAAVAIFIKLVAR